MRSEAPWALHGAARCPALLFIYWLWLHGARASVTWNATESVSFASSGFNLRIRAPLFFAQMAWLGDRSYRNGRVVFQHTALDLEGQWVSKGAGGGQRWAVIANTAACVQVYDFARVLCNCTTITRPVKSIRRHESIYHQL
jgi:hypothetical protein